MAPDRGKHKTLKRCTCISKLIPEAYHSIFLSLRHNYLGMKYFNTFQSANYDFYQELESICCSKLEHISLPVFTPSTPDPKAASVPSSWPGQSGQKEETTGQPKESPRETEKPDVFGTLSELSLALSLGAGLLCC